MPRGTSVVIQVFHAGAPDRPAAQYTAATRKMLATDIEPESAPTTSGTNASACRLAHSTTQRRYEPMRATACGVTSCSRAPVSIGIVATRPEASSPWPEASTNAGR